MYLILFFDRIPGISLSLLFQPKNYGPLLLEGPDMPAAAPEDPRDDDPLPSPNNNSGPLLLGHHEVPELTPSRLHRHNQIGMDKVILDVGNDSMVEARVPVERPTQPEAQAQWVINMDGNMIATIVLGVVVLFIVIFVMPRVGVMNGLRAREEGKTYYIQSYSQYPNIYCYQVMHFFFNL